MALIYTSFFSKFFTFKVDTRHHGKDGGIITRFLESMVRKTDSERRSQYFGSDPFQ